MEFDVLVLAAGYGTRLARDIAEDPSKEYAHLQDLPKPLLPIGMCETLYGDFFLIQGKWIFGSDIPGGVPLLSRWVHIFQEIPGVNSINIVVSMSSAQQ